MDRTELILKTKQLRGAVSGMGSSGAYAQASEFLRTYGGSKNSFYATLQSFSPGAGHSYIITQVEDTLSAFLAYLEAGLAEEISPERRAQLDVVSDFLEQAQILLGAKGVHPAGPAVLIGATPEEFLRTWVENQRLSLGVRKPGLEAYSDILRDGGFISKQDAKDITSWGGIRNHAAHGEWAEVSDKKRVQLMLEGVNLFMRKYGEPTSTRPASGAPTPNVRIQNI